MTIIIVSNRLPIVANRLGDGSLEFIPASGGLVTALKGLTSTAEFLWLGWIGVQISESEVEKVRLKLMAQYNLMPVFLEETLASKYYNGFSNETLWPLLHYLLGETKFNPDYWEAYYSVNQAFSEALKKLEPSENDIIWIHDYHLFLLPSIVRKWHPDIKVGFFLHTPFPSSEIFKALPVGKQIIESVLSSDLVGFQNHDYARHFQNSCEAYLSCKQTPFGIEYNGRLTMVMAYPVGIDPFVFQPDQDNEKVEDFLTSLRAKHHQYTIILGIDRLDYIKGLTHKVKGYSKFHELYPDVARKTILVQIAVPSRGDVQDYKRLQSHLFELTGYINARFGEPDYMPIYLIHHSVNATELCALYQTSDICLITSIRDGMNLVSFEYVAAQNQNSCRSLVLSKFAGSAQFLSGALTINPWSQIEIANSLFQCVKRTQLESVENFTQLQNQLENHTAIGWAERFLNSFDYPKQCPRTSLYKPSAYKEAVDVMLIDLRSARHPHHISNEEIFENLTSSNVIILSALSREKLSVLFPGLEYTLLSEYGLYCRPHGSNKWSCTAEMEFQNALNWKDMARPQVSFVSMRTPGSEIVEHPDVLAFVYKYGEKDFWNVQVEELRNSLAGTLTGLQVQIFIGENVLLVAPTSFSLKRALVNAFQIYQFDCKPSVKGLWLSGDLTDALKDIYGQLQSL